MNGPDVVPWVEGGEDHVQGEPYSHGLLLLKRKKKLSEQYLKGIFETNVNSLL